jgi:hypothetical protein
MPPELNGTHQLLVYAEEVNLLEENITTVKNKTESLIYARKEIDLDVNREN